jgi:hypothetical protein
VFETRSLFQQYRGAVTQGERLRSVAFQSRRRDDPSTEFRRVPFEISGSNRVRGGRLSPNDQHATVFECGYESRCLDRFVGVIYV